MIVRGSSVSTALKVCQKIGIYLLVAVDPRALVILAVSSLKLATHELGSYRAFSRKH